MVTVTEVRQFWDRSRGSLFGGGFMSRPTVRFEYKCPYCKHVNIRYERTGRIACSKCGRGFG